MSKNIFIVGTVGLPAEYGGFETLVDNLVSEELATGYLITVVCSTKAYSKKLESYKSAKLEYIPLKANGASSILYDYCSILLAMRRKADSVLLLGVSGATILPFIKLFSKIRIVTNIDGLEWKRDKWSKFTKSFLKFSESIAVRYSDVVISDNQAISDYVQSEYGKSSKVIAYGGEHSLNARATRGLDFIPNKDEGYFLGLCRIEPENNVDIILDAFVGLNKKLKFVGNWSNSEYGLSLKARYSKYSNISIIDPIYDVEPLFELRKNTACYIHGHSAGGTNPSLVEMMHFGKHVLAFDCAYNRATMEHKGDYFRNVKDLRTLVKNLISATDNGDVMKEIANRRYTWPQIRAEYFEVL